MNFITKTPRNSGAEPVEAVSLDRFCQERAIVHIDLLKLDVQGHEYSALRGAERLIREGRVGTIFMELNWTGATADALSPADESLRLLAKADFLFSKPGTHLNWKKAGEWLRSLGDVVARRAGA